jgi:two-component system, NarL family, nitrate/nitrite response regulator NarL
MNKIVIADDHPIFRSGIKSIVETLPDFELVGEAKDGAEAYQLILSQLPTIGILDLEMPLLNGLEVCKKVLNEKHFTKFIILTMHKEKHYFTDAMECGVMGYLLKDNAANDLVTCINEVNKGNKYVSHAIENYLTEHESIHLSTDALHIKTLLSPTEKVVLKLISEGKTSSEIASLLFVSPNTIDNHRANMNKKLNLGGEKNVLLKFAIQHKDLL